MGAIGIHCALFHITTVLLRVIVRVRIRIRVRFGVTFRAINLLCIPGAPIKIHSTPLVPHIVNGEVQHLKYCLEYKDLK